MSNIVNRIYHGLPISLQKSANKLYTKYRDLTWNNRPFPGFLIIGAQKSGTASLSNYLNQHPQLYLPMFKRELHFFDSGRGRPGDDFLKGERWYRSHFRTQHELGKDGISFESTPLYLFHPLSPERIYNMAPEIKLIALLRNPTQRAISHYFMSSKKNLESLPMLEAFQQEESRLERCLNEKDYKNISFNRFSYKSRGRYAEQLERYYKLFPSSQILLLSSEELFHNPKNILKKVFEFVAVDDSYTVPDLTPLNVGKNKVDIPADALQYLNEYFLPYNKALYLQTGINFGW